MRILLFILMFFIALQPKAQAPATDDFSTTLYKLVQDYPNNFEAVKGAQKGASRPKTYYALLTLPGADSAYFSSDMMATTLTYVCCYKQYATREEAEGDYKTVIAQVDKARLPVSFVKLDETKSEVNTSTAYMPFNPNGVKQYEHALIEVRLIKGFEFTKDYKMIDKFYTVVNIKTLH